MVYKRYWRFEFDRDKSVSNKAKHGIDFIEGQALWRDMKLIEFPTKSVGETRFLLVGLIGNKHWSAVITYRGELVRIISVRRSTQGEIKLYEKEN